MALPISLIGAQAPITPPLPAGALTDKALNAPDVSGGQAPQAFQAVLAEAVQRVDQYQASANTSIAQFLDGGDVELHQVALAVQKAETAFEFLVEVRNKVVQAYQEIMRMPV